VVVIKEDNKDTFGLKCRVKKVLHILGLVIIKTKDLEKESIRKNSKKKLGI